MSRTAADLCAVMVNHNAEETLRFRAAGEPSSRPGSTRSSWWTMPPTTGRSHGLSGLTGRPWPCHSCCRPARTSVTGLKCKSWRGTHAASDYVSGGEHRPQSLTKERSSTDGRRSLDRSSRRGGHRACRLVESRTAISTRRRGLSERHLRHWPRFCRPVRCHRQTGGRGRWPRRRRTWDVDRAVDWVSGAGDAGTADCLYEHRGLLTKAGIFMYVEDLDSVLALDGARLGRRATRQRR